MSQIVRMGIVAAIISVADPGGPRGLWPPGPVKISHKKDGRRRRLHSFHVSRPPLPGRWIHYCILLWSLADLRGEPGTRPPPPGSKFFHFHAVFSKNLKNNSNFGSWRTPLGKILDPPLVVDCFNTQRSKCHRFIKLSCPLNPNLHINSGADPGFPVGGGAHPPGGGRQHTNLPDWSKNCMKLRKFFVCRGTCRSAPLDPTLQLLQQIVWNRYKARHAHKHLCTVLPIYSKIQVLPGITSCRLMKYNKPAVDLNDLLKNTYAKDAIEN